MCFHLTLGYHHCRQKQLGYYVSAFISIFHSLIKKVHHVEDCGMWQGLIYSVCMYICHLDIQEDSVK